MNRYDDDDHRKTHGLGSGSFSSPASEPPEDSVRDKGRGSGAGLGGMGEVVEGGVCRWEEVGERVGSFFDVDGLVSG